MFGNSNQQDDNTQQDTNQAFAGDQSQQLTAPSLPTMGGQDSPFGPSSTPTVPDPLNSGMPDLAAEPSNQAQSPDPSHMLSSQGTPDQQPAPTLTSSPTPQPGVDNDLVNIKQQALSQLSPLVSHLDQTAEEKFRTTMMMIQATDDQSLLKEAYDAAQKIEDDKIRAQALLDVINEINYFTQQSK